MQLMCHHIIFANYLIIWVFRLFVCTSYVLYIYIYTNIYISIKCKWFWLVGSFFLGSQNSGIGCGCGLGRPY